jgi:hypothetical protein
MQYTEQVSRFLFSIYLRFLLFDWQYFVLPREIKWGTPSSLAFSFGLFVSLAFDSYYFAYLFNRVLDSIM